MNIITRNKFKRLNANDDKQELHSPPIKLIRHVFEGQAPGSHQEQSCCLFIQQSQTVVVGVIGRTRAWVFVAVARQLPSKAGPFRGRDLISEAEGYPLRLR